MVMGEEDEHATHPSGSRHAGTDHPFLESVLSFLHGSSNLLFPFRIH